MSFIIHVIKIIHSKQRRKKHMIDNVIKQKHKNIWFTMW